MKKNAFSRVLALVMALIMVVGNAAMFAVADDGHDHSKTVTTTHPAEDEHRLDNVENYVQVGEPVPPSCVHGYTMYKCTDCGKYFADNFVDPIGESGHDWEVTVEPTCTTAGSKFCHNCNKTVELDALGHTWDNDDKDCTVVKHCTECNAESTGEHTWSETPEIVKTPTHDVNGVARYTCTVCSATKDVDIIYGDHLPGEHDYKLIEPKDATCTETGNKYYRYCDGCETYWLWNTKKGEWYEVKQADTVIPALGHTYYLKADESNLIEKIYDSKNHKCQADVYCARCGETHQIVDIAHTNAPDPDNKGKVNATCHTWGYDQLFGCLYCGYQTMVNAVAPYGHVDPKTGNDYSNYEVAKKLKLSVTEVAATCTTDGSATWNCPMCGDPFTKVHTKLGTNAVEVKVPAACNQFAYTYSYCANENCNCSTLTDRFTVKDKDGKDYTVYLVKYENGKAIPVFVYLVKDSYSVDFDGGFDPDNHVEGNNWYYGVINKPTCLEEGDRAWFCEYCKADVKNYEPIPKLDHYTYEQAQEEGFYTYEYTFEWDNQIHCVYREWYCPNGCYDTEGYRHSETYVAHNFDAKYDGNITQNVSCITDGWTIYVCKDCGMFEVDEFGETVYHDFVAKTNATAFDTLEEAKKSHKGLEWAKDFKVDDCETQMNFVLYHCTICDKKVAIITSRGSHTMPDTFDSQKNEFAAKAPTCTEDGWTAQYECVICGKLIESEVIPALGHTTSCGECTRCHEFFAHDWKTTDERDGHHNWINGEFVFGYIHATCTKCNKELVYNYYRWNTPEFHTPGVTVEAKAPTCVEPGCTEEIECSCGYILQGSLMIPPTPDLHYNKGGELILDRCDSTVTDRHCVNCNQDIGKSHNYQETLFPATCLNPQYTLKKCLWCGAEEEKVYVYEMDYGQYDPERHHDDKQIGHANATYHTPETWTYECQLCNRILVKEGNILTGVGYFLDVDNAVKSGVGYSDSSLIAVTVSIDANKVNVWGFQFDIAYDKSVMTLESYKFLSDPFLPGLTANATVNENVEDVIRVAGYIANDINGEAVNYNVGEKHSVIVLYFRVDCAIDDYQRLPADDATVVPASFVLQDMITIAQKTNVKGNVVNGYVENRYEYGRTASDDVVIDKFLDIDEDGRVNIMDVKYTLDIIQGAVDVDYDVVVDVDKDGEITGVDLDYLMKYIVGKITYDDLTALGVPAVAPEA